MVQDLQNELSRKDRSDEHAGRLVEMRVTVEDVNV